MRWMRRLPGNFLIEESAVLKDVDWQGQVMEGIDEFH